MKELLTSPTRWDDAATAANLGLTAHRVWALRTSGKPHTHPRSLPFHNGCTTAGLALLRAMQAGRLVWDPRQGIYVPSRPRHGSPRVATKRTLRRRVTAPARKPIPQKRLDQIARQREIRFQTRRKAVLASKSMPQRLRDLLLDRTLWTIRRAGDEFNVGIGRLGYRRTKGKVVVVRPASGPVGWFDLEPDDVDGYLSENYDNNLLEAGRARQLALDNGWIRWDAAADDLVPVEPIVLATHGGRQTEQRRAVIEADDRMHPELKRLLLDRRWCTPRQVCDELDISLSRLDLLRARPWYPEEIGGRVELGALLQCSMQRGSHQWFPTAAQLVPVMPRHGRPPQFTGLPVRRKAVRGKTRRREEEEAQAA